MNYNWVQNDYEIQSDAHLKLRGEIRRGGEWNMRNEQNMKVDQRQKQNRWGYEMEKTKTRNKREDKDRKTGEACETNIWVTCFMVGTDTLNAVGL